MPLLCLAHPRPAQLVALLRRHLPRALWLLCPQTILSMLLLRLLPPLLLLLPLLPFLPLLLLLSLVLTSIRAISAGWQRGCDR